MEEVAKVFGLDLKLFIVQLINFGIVIFILTKLLYKPVLKTIDERKTVIEEGVNNAKKSFEVMASAEKDAENIVSEAKKHASKLVDETKIELTSYRSMATEEANAEKARLIKEAQINANKLKESMIESSKEQIAKMAILSAERIIKEKVS